MSVDNKDAICVDLDAVQRLTRAQDAIAVLAQECASELSAPDLCRWADDGPVRRSAEATAEQLHDLASRFRSCGIAVDAVAADLGRAGRGFADAEDVAVVAVSGWSR